MYMAGEETVCGDDQGNLVWMTKTHWPMGTPLGAKQFSADKCFVIVRNPIDLIASSAILGNINS